MAVGGDGLLHPFVAHRRGILRRARSSDLPARHTRGRGAHPRPGRNGLRRGTCRKGGVRVAHRQVFTVYEADGSNYCYNGGRGATSCSISGGIDIKGGGASAACDVSCQTGYYACCGIRCTCEKY